VPPTEVSGISAVGRLMEPTTRRKIAFPAPVYDIPDMWCRPFRYLVSMLVGLAFLGGASVQAMPIRNATLSIKVGTMMANCTNMAMMHDTDASEPPKGMTPDCVKSMQCLSIPDSPTRTSMIEEPVSYDAVAYWSVVRRLSGLSAPPPASPPRPV